MSIQVFKPLFRDEAIKKVNKVMKSGWLGCGKLTETFEQELKKYLKTDGYPLLVNSATSALHLALKINNVQEGDEIISTSNTFISTNSVILQEKAKVVFCDIEKKTGNIDPNKLEELITPKTKGIMVVHISGSSAKMDQINQIAKKYNLFVIEDGAHASGMKYSNGKYFGDSKNLCVFSHQAVKNLISLGDAGTLILRTKEEYELAKKLRWVGIDKETYNRSMEDGKYLWKYSVDHLGYKYNPTDLDAAALLVHLKYLDSDNQRRKQIAMKYKKELNSFNGLKFVENSGEPAFHFIPMFAPRRNDLLEHLRKNDINCGVHYYGNHNYKILKDFKVDLPNTDWWSEHEITLPMHLLLTDEDVERIIEVVKEGW